MEEMEGVSLVISQASAGVCLEYRLTLHLYSPSPDPFFPSQFILVKISRCQDVKMLRWFSKCNTQIFHLKTNRCPSNYGPYSEHR